MRIFSSDRTLLRFSSHVAVILLTTSSWSFAQESKSGSGNVPVSSTSTAAESSTADYLLRPSDVLQIRVFQEDDLTREVSVSQDFTISLPLVGTIDVRKRSVRQAEEFIRQLYDRDYLVNPQVSLIVLKYAERAVNVIGSVNTPQAVPFPPERGLNLLEAITRAGGFSRLADKTRVRIIRKDDKGVSVTYTINAEKLISGTSDNSWSLQVDDVIEIPERIF
jgi:polysaccharide export outer membrane protein